MERRSSRDKVTDKLSGEPSISVVVVDEHAGGPLYWDRLFVPIGYLGCL